MSSGLIHVKACVRISLKNISIVDFQCCINLCCSFLLRLDDIAALENSTVLFISASVDHALWL